MLEHGGLDTWLARRCPALRRLAIRYEDPLCGPRRLCASSLSGALLLAELELASCWVAWPGLELPGLRRLRLSRVPAEGPPSGDELVRAAPALEALEMDGVPLLRPAALPRLPSTLTRLELRDCRLEGVPWAQVSELGRLEALHLGCNPGLDVSGLHALASLTRLSALSLECCGLHSVEALSALPSLQALGLGGNWLAGARLQPLAALTRLSALGLECCGLRGGLEVLAGLHSLAALDLSWNQELEDNDLRHLPISITHLSLHGWSGLPRALPQLARLSGLRQLGLRHSGVNTQELARHVQGLVCSVLTSWADGGQPVSALWGKAA